ncbi:uncharacterized protein KY384_007535 [Bacidia gigantensis]|uniref:uncharacterized protein n=1 Tax=Bacidia gigantensis TaxID=2732470 RepID=UPI001D04C6D9|nr:uncharacterized protein KY384_007535 [Bacidia gigantensis]KAG8527383.1 hypothetical protein KY384_007535 [Bacidia gigantensis]
MAFSTASQSEKNPGIVYSGAWDSFVRYIGQTECAPDVIQETANSSTSTVSANVSSPSSAFMTTISTVAPAEPLSATSQPTSNGTLASSSGTQNRAGLQRKEKIITGVVVSISVLILSLSGYLVWHRRKTNNSNVKEGSLTPDGDTQPYLQYKAELEDLETRKHELDAPIALSEMQGTNYISEMEGSNPQVRLSLLTELNGPEHSTELDTSKL